jgi:hypothetical protein
MGDIVNRQIPNIEGNFGGEKLCSRTKQLECVSQPFARTAVPITGARCERVPPQARRPEITTHYADIIPHPPA